MSTGGGDQTPTAEEIRGMSREDAMIAGSEADGVHLAHRRDRFPVRGTKAEKRAERGVALTFALSGLAGIGFIVWFIVGPWRWHLPNRAQNFQYYTPILGVTLAGMLLFMGIGMVLWAKWLMPDEEAVQDRHDEPSTEEDRLLAEATLAVGLEDTGLPRRSIITRSLLFAGGAIATVPLIALVGGMLKKPGTQLLHTLFRPNKKLFGSASNPNGYVPIVDVNWKPVSPDDLLPGAVETVFPGVRQKTEWGTDGITDAASPTLIIRLRPGQKVQPRKGQGSFGWPADNPEYVAFSKICTHAGCPASLYEQQTTRLLCPCHQSQFEVLKDAKPVFGPATRSLPKLPLTVLTGPDGRQYFYAKSDYVEPIGPGFWERR